jgi:anti-anti-sigma factor
MFKTELPGFTVWSPDSKGFWTWTRNGTPIVTTPTGIDVGNQDAMRRELLAATAYSAVIVVDMSATTCCDVFGMRVLAEIASKLADGGGELRAVISHVLTLRSLAITRHDSQLRIFPSLPEALSATRQNRETQSQVDAAAREHGSPHSLALLLAHRLRINEALSLSWPGHLRTAARSFRTRPPQQDFRTCSLNGLPVVSAPDYIDISNVNQLCRALLAAGTDAMVVVVDMTATTFCDASGLGALVRMYRWLKASCVELRVVGCTDNVRLLMAITGDDLILPTFDSVTEAVTMKPQSWWPHHQAA